jgi:hypothetical protein
MSTEWSIRRVFRWAGLALVASCGERDRLTFPTENPGDGLGPVSVITEPVATDTVVVEGDLLTIRGRTTDADGVDSVYFDLEGANHSFAPIDGQGEDTVEFALQLSTLNFLGDTVLLTIHGVDMLGVQGGPVGRRIRLE